MPQFRNIRGIVLAIAVERRNPDSVRRLDPGADRRALSVALGVTQQSQSRSVACKLQNLGYRPIFAAIVDKQNFIVNNTIERGADFLQKRSDVVRLVLHWNDD